MSAILDSKGRRRFITRGEAVDLPNYEVSEEVSALESTLRSPPPTPPSKRQPPQTPPSGRARRQYDRSPGSVSPSASASRRRISPLGSPASSTRRANSTSGQLATSASSTAGNNDMFKYGTTGKNELTPNLSTVGRSLTADANPSQKLYPSYLGSRLAQLDPTRASGPRATSRRNSSESESSIHGSVASIHSDGSFRESTPSNLEQLSTPPRSPIARHFPSKSRPRSLCEPQFSHVPGQGFNKSSESPTRFPFASSSYESLDNESNGKGLSRANTVGSVNTRSSKEDISRLQHARSFAGHEGSDSATSGISPSSSQFNVTKHFSGSKSKSWQPPSAKSSDFNSIRSKFSSDTNVLKTRGPDKAISPNRKPADSPFSREPSLTWTGSTGDSDASITSATSLPPFSGARTLGSESQEIALITRRPVRDKVVRDRSFDSAISEPASSQSKAEMEEIEVTQHAPRKARPFGSRSQTIELSQINRRGLATSPRNRNVNSIPENKPWHRPVSSVVMEQAKIFDSKSEKLKPQQKRVAPHLPQSVSSGKLEEGGLDIGKAPYKVGEYKSATMPAALGDFHDIDRRPSLPSPSDSPTIFKEQLKKDLSPTFGIPSAQKRSGSFDSMGKKSSFFLSASSQEDKKSSSEKINEKPSFDKAETAAKGLHTVLGVHKPSSSGEKLPRSSTAPALSGAAAYQHVLDSLSKRDKLANQPKSFMRNTAVTIDTKSLRKDPDKLESKNVTTTSTGKSIDIKTQSIAQSDKDNKASLSSLNAQKSTQRLSPHRPISEPQSIGRDVKDVPPLNIKVGGKTVTTTSSVTSLAKPKTSLTLPGKLSPLSLGNSSTSPKVSPTRKDAPTRWSPREKLSPISLSPGDRDGSSSASSRLSPLEKHAPISLSPSLALREIKSRLSPRPTDAGKYSSEKGPDISTSARLSPRPSKRDPVPSTVSKALEKSSPQFAGKSHTISTAPTSVSSQSTQSKPTTQKSNSQPSTEPPEPPPRVINISSLLTSKAPDPPVRNKHNMIFEPIRLDKDEDLKTEGKRGLSKESIQSAMAVLDDAIAMLNSVAVHGTTGSPGVTSVNTARVMATISNGIDLSKSGLVKYSSPKPVVVTSCYASMPLRHASPQPNVFTQMANMGPTKLVTAPPVTMTLPVQKDVTRLVPSVESVVSSVRNTPIVSEQVMPVRARLQETPSQVQRLDMPMSQIQMRQEAIKCNNVGKKVHQPDMSMLDQILATMEEQCEPMPSVSNLQQMSAAKSGITGQLQEKSKLSSSKNRRYADLKTKPAAVKSPKREKVLLEPEKPLDELEARRSIVREDSFDCLDSDIEEQSDSPIPLPRDSVILRHRYHINEDTSSSESSSAGMPRLSPRVIRRHKKAGSDSSSVSAYKGKQHLNVLSQPTFIRSLNGSAFPVSSSCSRLVEGDTSDCDSDDSSWTTPATRIS